MKESIETVVGLDGGSQMKIPLIHTGLSVSSDIFKCEDLVGFNMVKEKLLCIPRIMLYHIYH